MSLWGYDPGENVRGSSKGSKTQGYESVRAVKHEGYRQCTSTAVEYGREPGARRRAQLGFSQGSRRSEQCLCDKNKPSWAIGDAECTASAISAATEGAKVRSPVESEIGSCMDEFGLAYAPDLACCSRKQLLNFSTYIHRFSSRPANLAPI